MKQDFYLGMPFVGLVLFAFFTFATVFVVAFFKALTKQKSEVSYLEQLPLTDDPQEAAR